jgi:hypothetical protein
MTLLKEMWARFVKRSLLHRISICFLIFIILGGVALSSKYQHEKAKFTQANQLMAEADAAAIDETGQYDVYEKVAINRFLDLFDAYNAKDFNKVKQIDLRAKKVTDTPKNRFLATMGDAKQFTLHYVGISFAGPEIIAGRFLYSYETKVEGQIGKTVPLVISNFVLVKYLGSWWVGAVRAYHGKEKGLNYFRSVIELKEKSKQKYGVEDLKRL